MSCSTSSKSLKPIPHGRPGVASSINRPNSGWNVGAVLATLPCVRSVKGQGQRVGHAPLLFFMEFGNTTALREKFRIGCKGLEDICLSQRELDLAILVCKRNDQILDLGPVSFVSVSSETSKVLEYLITPQQGVALLALCSTPYLQQLLRAMSDQKSRLERDDLFTVVPQCPTPAR